MNQKHEITLDYPVEWNGETLTSLRLRRPKGSDIRKLQSGSGTDLDRSFKMMADLAEVEISVIDDLDAEDLGKVESWLEPILNPKKKAGSPPA